MAVEHRLRWTHTVDGVDVVDGVRTPSTAYVSERLQWTYEYDLNITP